MTSNLRQRLLTVIVGVPVSLAIILGLPYFHFLAYCLVLTAASFIATWELSKMLFGKTVPVVFFAWILPFSQYICIEFCLASEITDIILIAEIMTAFALEILQKSFEESIIRTSKNCLLIVYPSYLMTYLVKLVGLQTIRPYILALFFVLVFGNDIFCYVFGMLFGKNNAGIFKASPKKSVAGFVGGTLTTIALSVVLCTETDSYLIRALLGFFISLAANIGDLIESVLKRSAGVKDSGNIIPGRGGILDCIDSISVAAPVYYLFLCLF